jgi:aspartyl-tRNA(Asn)/glutamyl-tRNA(Gln) amidotransferase subunit A
VAAAVPTDVASLTLKKAVDLIRSKGASPVELTEACLKRIDQYNSKLNAFITVIPEQALAAARDMEAEQQRGKWRGPLHGVPIALKDNIDTAGVRSTGASELFKDRVPSEDAEVARRLKNAGAILLGKLNLHEFAYGGSSTRPRTARCTTRGDWTTSRAEADRESRSPRTSATRRSGPIPPGPSACRPLTAASSG